MADSVRRFSPAQVPVSLAPGRVLRHAGGSVLSAMRPRDDGGRYDRRAALYDRLVANRIYNQALWGTSPQQYTAFAAESMAAGEGPLLDAACGSAVFTAAGYRAADRPIVLTDRSLAMLGRAGARLGPASNRVSLVQADLFDLPFPPRSFDTVACHGALHVFDDLAAAFAALRAQLAPGGVLYATALVAETPIAAGYLALLYRLGEVATPRRQADLLASARTEFGEVTARRRGGMCFFTART